MKLKNLYLLLCILGIILPYSQFMPYFLNNGFNVISFLQQAFNNPINAFISFDLLITALAITIFIVIEGQRLKIKLYWVPILSIVMVGAAFGVPLFLYLRELKLEKLNKNL